MEKKIIDTIPKKVLSQVTNSQVVLMGFAAGPGFVGQKTERPQPPVDFLTGMAWLENYRNVFRRARLEFRDGSRLWFCGPIFDRYEPPSKDVQTTFKRKDDFTYFNFGFKA